MGIYNVKHKQDLSGIATLTHDPLVTHVEPYWRDIMDIEHVKQEIAEATGVPKGAFDDNK